MSIFKIISEVQNGNKSNLELEEYLLLNNKFVLSNVMKEIVKREHISPNIESRLKEISSYRNREHILIGIYTIGHLSIATLIKLGYSNYNLDIYSNLDDFDKEIVNKLLDAYDEVL